MPRKTRFVSYRISAEVEAELQRQAKAAGIRPSAFACEALLEKLERAQSERRGWLELFEEVHRLRRDLALSTEAVLTVTVPGETPRAKREKAAAWVRQHLPH